MELNIVILAAGKGTRMKSVLPKVLHPLAKKPLLAHVIDTAKEINPQTISVVYGHGGEAVKEAFSEYENIMWCEQAEQLGTGHAVAQALPTIDNQGMALVLYGDVPLIKKNTLTELLAPLDLSSIGLLTVVFDDPTGYGRIIRNEAGDVVGIVEQKDANPEQLAIQEINTGIMAVPVNLLKEWLPQLGNNNSQGEYYLTDLIAMAAENQIPIKAMQATSTMEVEGVNNRKQLATLERCYQLELAEKLMTDGVTLMDPSRIDIRGSVSTGTDITIDVNTIFEGKVEIGSHSEIGANCVIINSVIGEGVTIKPNSVIEDAVIKNNCDVGPFARIRPQTVLEEGARVGNFVETKKSTIGKGSKVNHLTYIGDAEIGENVNVGAGTITCNYDGVNKHKTIIEDGAFIGSNSSLVAPVVIEKEATVGAGSAVSKRVPAGKLTLTRAKQLTINGWKRPEKKK